MTRSAEAQRRRGEVFRRLHAGKPILVLPNVWDVASARIVEQAGFPAIATSSAGVAFALGYPDGERISRDEMAAAVARIVAHVAVPVTADMESGYGRRPDDIKALRNLPFPRNAQFLYLKDEYGSPEFWRALVKAPKSSSPSYAGALGALSVRGGIMPKQHFLIACGAPLKLTRHMSPETIVIPEASWG